MHYSPHLFTVWQSVWCLSSSEHESRLLPAVRTRHRLNLKETYISSKVAHNVAVSSQLPKLMVCLHFNLAVLPSAFAAIKEQVLRFCRSACEERTAPVCRGCRLVVLLQTDHITDDISSSSSIRSKKKKKSQFSRVNLRGKKQDMHQRICTTCI